MSGPSRPIPQRLTALVILGIRDRETFPLIFFRENCADMAIESGDVDEAFIASSRAVVVTGTHFSTPSTAAANFRAMEIARRHGRKVIFDIDYRPVLWGLTGHGLGENRFVDNAEVTRRLQAILPGSDVIVGTEEEIHIAGGSTDTLAALTPHPQPDSGAHRPEAWATRAASPSPRPFRRGSMTGWWSLASPSRSTTCWARAMPS